MAASGKGEDMAAVRLDALARLKGPAGRADQLGCVGADLNLGPSVQEPIDQRCANVRCGREHE